MVRLEGGLPLDLPEIGIGEGGQGCAAHIMLVFSTPDQLDYLLGEVKFYGLSDLQEVVESRIDHCVKEHERKSSEQAAYDQMIQEQRAWVDLMRRQHTQSTNITNSASSSNMNNNNNNPPRLSREESFGYDTSSDDGAVEFERYQSSLLLIPSRQQTGDNESPYAFELDDVF